MAATHTAPPTAGPATNGAPPSPAERQAPQNLEAEEYVLGAMMLDSTGAAIERILATGIEADNFYRESHAKIFRAEVALHRLDLPVDAITVADRLQELGQLDEIGGKDRIREIATVVPATANAPFHADIVIREARRRGYRDLGRDLIDRVDLGDTPDEIHEYADRRLLDEISRGGNASIALEGLTHQEVLQLEMPEHRYLVDGLIPIGAAGTIAAVPESHKSWLAQAIAVRVAAGQGWILGRKVTDQANVGYLWQDDSTREEAERIQAFEAVHAQKHDLPITWFLNLGVELPRDFSRIRATIEHHKLGLLVLDSLYNFLPAADLKDEEPEKIIAQLKLSVCDPTGCTILIVDHMTWGSDTGRSRNRAYGGVFKNAATRFGIYIDIINEKMTIEARGNNITGFKSLAYWDRDDLELKLIAGELAEEDLKGSPQAIRDWVIEQGGDVQAKVVRAHFDIAEATLTRRIARLRELGVEYVAGRGKPARLVTQHDDQTDSNLLTLDLSQDSSSPEFHHEGTSTHDGTFPHNDAGLREVPSTPVTDTVTELESGDLQGKQVPSFPHPLTGDVPAGAGAHAPASARETTKPVDRLARHRHWLDQGGWMQPDLPTALVLQFPMLDQPDITLLLAHAATIEARELGGPAAAVKEPPAATEPL